MQLGQTCLPAAEKQRRLVGGLCLYCGEAGHRVRRCPLKHQSTSVSREALTSLTSRTSSCPRSPLEISLSQSDRHQATPPSPLLVDPGDQMQLGQTCLPAAEKQRRLVGGLCLYCGEAGHRVRRCPLKHQSTSVSREALTSLTSRTSSCPRSPLEISLSQSDRHQATPPSPLLVDPGDQMQLGQTRLPAAEKQRRLVGGLCLYCGEAGHRVRRCPLKHQSSSVIREALISLTSRTSSCPRSPLGISLSQSDRHQATPPSPLLVDPGEEMQLGQTRLPTAEKQRRLVGDLCLYCGEAGHRVRRCPLKHQSSSVSREALTSLTSRTSSRPRSPLGISLSQSDRHQATPPSPLSVDRGEEMQLGQTRLPTAEKQRRLVGGLCLYCGEAGHGVRRCPLKHQSSSVIREALTSLTSRTSSCPRSPLGISLSQSDRHQATPPSPLLVDPGDQMQLGQTRLPAAEKQRRLVGGLCLYCGEAGHRVRRCPLKHQSSSVSREALTSLISCTSSCPRSPLGISLSQSDRHQATPPPPLSVDPGDQMQLGRTRLPAAEKQRRLVGSLSLYCGEAGHHVRRCPLKHQRSSVSREALTSLISCTSSRPRSPLAISLSQSDRHQATPPSPLSVDPGDQMQLGRTRLPAAKKQRRLVGDLCLYCGEAGHRVRRCPLKHQSSSVSREALMSLTSRTSSCPRSPLGISLSQSDRHQATPPSPLLVDPGEEMQLGQTRLPTAEKQRRLVGDLCLCCGEAGHRVRRCPLKHQSSSVSREALTSLTSRMSSRPRSPLGISLSQSDRHQATPPSPLSVDRGEEMQLGQTRLPTAEKQRRLVGGLCLYCGEAGHGVRRCPLKHQSSSVSREALTSLTSRTSSCPRSPLGISLSQSDRHQATPPSPLLVDPGDQMQLGQTRLPAAEKQRRLVGGLCLYCGEAGHRVRRCPLKHQSSSVSREALTSLISCTSSCPRSPLGISLSQSDRHQATPPPPLSVDPGHHMQMGQTRLPAAEKQRPLVGGLCLYCGEAGHRVRRCPLNISARQSAGRR
ncbi:uncharacterized protein LOC113155357 [Anabas testudineus]|uniref:uncharacterized protein LOC113155357 n=1 Tax=Anabas testudineus TaxID=64144 RepID=UPI000E461613|nr:uncharacterized protein LOC113155357 [Anabas testudineus]